MPIEKNSIYYFGYQVGVSDWWSGKCFDPDQFFMHNDAYVSAANLKAGYRAGWRASERNGDV